MPIIVDLGVAAEQLRALAIRVRRLMPLNRYPERFHEEKSELVHDLTVLADQLGGPSSKPKRNAFHRQVVVTQIINGRRVIVQSPRKSFAIFVGK